MLLKGEKMDISKVLRIILIRSITYLSLLVIIIFAILYFRDRPIEIPKGSEPNPKNIIAIVNGYSRHKTHIKGLRDGLLFKGINFPCIEYTSIDEIKDEDLMYIFGADKVKSALKKFPERTIIGYARIREKPSANYSGIFSGFDWRKNLKLYRTILPEIKTIGLLYTLNLPESRKQVESLQEAAKDYPTLHIEALPVAENGRDLKKKLNSLLDNADAILGLVHDKNIEASLSVISASCLNRKIPFIGGGKAGAQMGALVALEYNQELLGRKVAEIISQIIKSSENPPIFFPQPEIFINISTSYKLNIIFPPDIRLKAKEKYH